MKNIKLFTLLATLPLIASCGIAERALDPRTEHIEKVTFFEYTGESDYNQFSTSLNTYKDLVNDKLTNEGLSNVSYSRRTYIVNTKNNPNTDYTYETYETNNVFASYDAETKVANSYSYSNFDKQEESYSTTIELYQDRISEYQYVDLDEKSITFNLSIRCYDDTVKLGHAKEVGTNMATSFGNLYRTFEYQMSKPVEQYETFSQSDKDLYHFYYDTLDDATIVLTMRFQIFGERSDITTIQYVLGNDYFITRISIELDAIVETLAPGDDKLRCKTNYIGESMIKYNDSEVSNTALNTEDFTLVVAN